MTVSRGQAGPASPPPPDRAGTTAARVVEVALELVETDGLSALTMRRVAAKLGVAVTAIYWHVGDKAALLDAVVDQVIARVAAVPVRGTDPVTRITSVWRAWRRNLLEEPELIALVHNQGRTAQLFQPVRRVLVHELTAAGVRGHEAALALHAILHFVTGSVLTDLQVERAPNQRVASEDLWEPADVDGTPELLDELRHPTDPAELFDYALVRLVRAVTTP
jgi:AcrR family transcriptional regulator